jgi:hypothetical protein
MAVAGYRSFASGGKEGGGHEVVLCVEPEEKADPSPASRVRDDNEQQRFAKMLEQRLD